MSLNISDFSLHLSQQLPSKAQHPAPCRKGWGEGGAHYVKAVS